jgi:hypothetical protein
MQLGSGCAFLPRTVDTHTYEIGTDRGYQNSRASFLASRPVSPSLEDPEFFIFDLAKPPCMSLIDGHSAVAAEAL